MAIVFCPKCDDQREHTVVKTSTGRVYTCKVCGGVMVRPLKGYGKWKSGEDLTANPLNGVCPTFSTYDPLPGEPREFRKKTTIRAVKISSAFEVVTLEGAVRGKAGDWLAKGINNELYPINAEVFEKSYEEVDGGNSNVKKDDVRA